MKQLSGTDPLLAKQHQLSGTEDAFLVNILDTFPELMQELPPEHLEVARGWTDESDMALVIRMLPIQLETFYLLQGTEN